MCVRYSASLTLDEIRKALPFTVERNTKKSNPRSNVGPKTNNPVVCEMNGQLTLDYMNWGLVPHFAKEPLKLNTFNCRIESLEKLRPIWACAKTKRGIVPMNGYYEWQYESLDKTPYFFKNPNDKLTCALAVWDESADGTTYAIVTMPASKRLARIHPRMPVLVNYENALKWIQGEWPQVLELSTAFVEPEFYAVSTRVNKISNQSADLTNPTKTKTLDLAMWASKSAKTSKRPKPE